MRRLVVISNRKSKFIAASVGAVLSLTSIHLAATARIATLKREQELAALSNQQSAISTQPGRVDAHAEGAFPDGSARGRTAWERACEPGEED